MFDVERQIKKRPKELEELLEQERYPTGCEFVIELFWKVYQSSHRNVTVGTLKEYLEVFQMTISETEFDNVLMLAQRFYEGM